MSAKLRPRIKVKTHLSILELIVLIKEKFKDEKFTGWAKDNYALIYSNNEEYHIWTPQLNLQFEQEGNKTLIRGVIGPSASVWTAFIFLFSILGFIAFVSLFWGLTLLNLDQSASVLWVFPIASFLIILVYIFGKLGQQITKSQVQELKFFIDEIKNYKGTP